MLVIGCVNVFRPAAELSILCLESQSRINEVVWVVGIELVRLVSLGHGGLVYLQGVSCIRLSSQRDQASSSGPSV